MYVHVYYVYITNVLKLYQTYKHFLTKERRLFFNSFGGLKALYGFTCVHPVRFSIHTLARINIATLHILTWRL